MSYLTPFMMAAAPGDDPIEYFAADIRRMFAAVFPRGGIIGFGSLKVAHRAAGANMSVDVAAGSAAVPCSLANDGHYQCISTSVVNVVIPAPPASGTRHHIIVVQVRDKQVDGARTQYDFDIECVADTGSGQPATPSNALLLAVVNVASTNSTVTDSMIDDSRVPAGPKTTGPSVGQCIANATRAFNSGSNTSETLFSDTPISFTIDTPRFVHIRFSASFSSSASSAVLMNLYRNASAVVPGLGSTKVYITECPGSNFDATVLGSHVERLTTPGTYTYALSYVPRTGSAFLDNAFMGPLELAAFDAGPIG